LITSASSSKRAPSVGIAVDAMYLRSAVADLPEFRSLPCVCAFRENPRYSSALRLF
jgi:hypothetical protein